MSLRRSSLALIVVGMLLVATASLIHFVLVPSMTKLPADLDKTSMYSGTVARFDPARFGLGDGSPVTSERRLTVDRVDGDVAVVTSSALVRRPEGETTSSHTYAIDRGDYSQAPAPEGVEVEDQKGGMTFSLPLNPSPDGASLYDTVTREAIPLEHTGDSVVEGRDAFVLTGTISAPVADPEVLAPAQAGIAAMARVGDGTVLPKQMVQLMAGILPAERKGPLAEVLDSLPDLVPVVLTSDNTIEMFVDKRFGAPLRTVQDQTTVLNVAAGDTLLPVIDLSRSRIGTDDASAADAASELSSSQWMLDAVSRWVPLGLVVLGALLILAGIVRRKPIDDDPAAVTPVGGAPGDEKPGDGAEQGDDKQGDELESAGPRT